jgi:hypothetical protein
MKNSGVWNSEVPVNMFSENVAIERASCRCQMSCRQSTESFFFASSIFFSGKIIKAVWSCTNVC